MSQTDSSIHVVVSLVLYGNSTYALETLTALEQQDLDDDINISLVIVDNGIPDTLRSEIFDKYAGKIVYIQNFDNLGFSGAVNQSLEQSLKYKADFMLLLNPDLLLETVAIREFIRASTRNPNADFFTAKLLRANSDLSPSDPPIIDACGMKLESNLRHLDIFSGELDTGQAQIEKEVFGGTGACLLIRLSNITRMLLPRSNYEPDLWKIYPQLKQGSDSRPQLLDEAFFAYREDADLAIRAQTLGLIFIYCPLVVGYHVRRVLPENRANLPAEINRLSVRNRFLLQLNNVGLICNLEVLFLGIVVRNILVIMVVLLKERTSIKAFSDLWILKNRALANRHHNRNQAKVDTLIKWILNAAKT